MNLEELQAALDRKYFWRSEQNIMEVPVKEFELFVNALRLVANPNYEAAADDLEVHLPESIQPYAFRMATDAINAALGITSSGDH
jgi:hypothetical protein